MKWLSASLLLARVRGMDIRLHFSMLFSIPIAYYLFRPVELREFVIAFSWLLGFILCIFLHELGHALTAMLVGIEVKSVVVWLLGGFTALSRNASKPSHTLAISAAGPLVNMLLAFLSVLFYMISYLVILPTIQDVETFLWVQSFDNLFFSLALVNLVLIVFNLLPIYPLDGGNILHAALEMFFGKSNADLVTLVIGIPTLLCLLALGIFLRDYLLILSCVLIAIALSTLNRSSLRWLNLGVNYLFKRGGYHYLQGDYDRAMQYYTSNIEKEPNQPGYYLARAACLLNILQRERALADVERALKLAPNNALALQLRGEIYMLEKDYDRAEEFFVRALQINPHWGVPYFDRGSMLLEKKEYQAALVELDQAIAFMPQFPLFFLIRSIAHFYLGDLKSAHKDQDAALNLSEKDALVMSELNQPVYEDRLDWALDYYARILDKKPRWGLAYQARADAYRINGQYENAIADYTRAIESISREAPLYIGRGKSYQYVQDFESAILDFNQALVVADKSHLKREINYLLQDLRYI
jgi:tetratricopeptide (TPR) repeat protein